MLIVVPLQAEEGSLGISTQTHYMDWAMGYDVTWTSQRAGTSSEVLGKFSTTRLVYIEYISYIVNDINSYTL